LLDVIRDYDYTANRGTTGLTNNTNGYDNKIDIDNNVVSSNPVIALLQEARRIKLWEESLLEHGINPE
jgi:hypothetical protein